MIYIRIFGAQTVFIIRRHKSGLEIFCIYTVYMGTVLTANQASYNNEVFTVINFFRRK